MAGRCKGDVFAPTTAPSHLPLLSLLLRVLLRLLPRERVHTNRRGLKIPTNSQAKVVSFLM